MVDRVKAREVIFLNSAFFVLGFTFVFSMVGVLLQTVLSKASLDAVNTVRLIGGAGVLAFGLFFIACAKLDLSFFCFEHKNNARKLRQSCLTTLVFRIAFVLVFAP